MNVATWVNLQDVGKGWVLVKYCARTNHSHAARPCGRNVTGVVDTKDKNSVRVQTFIVGTPTFRYAVKFTVFYAFG